MSNPEVRQRVQLFSCMRAAQRALARCIHPSQLAPLRQASPEILIRLQGLSSLSSPGKKRDPNAPDADALEESLQEIDSLLAAQTEGTLEVVRSLEFGQLRASGWRLAQNHPEELSALIDIMLRGDLEDEKLLRLLEYLITKLCSEEWSGRMTVVREPADVTPGLRALARELVEKAEIIPEAAEKVLRDAQAGLVHGVDMESTRNEMRAYKAELGRSFLHPRILAATVSYNTAMWNKVTADVETSLGIDQLADDLLSEMTPESAPDAPSEHRSESSPSGFRTLPGFQRIGDAFAKRLSGQEIADTDAKRVVSRVDLEGFRPAEIEAFEAPTPTPVQRLIRDAVVTARLVRAGQQIADPLQALDLDLVALEEQGVEELIDEIVTEARSLFAQSRYDDAFLISAIKTGNLTSLAPRKVGDQTSQPKKRSFGLPADFGVAVASMAKPLGLVATLGLMALAIWSLERGAVSRLSPDALSTISPFLLAGQVIREDPTRFVGETGPAWEYLGTPERREVALAIAGHFQDESVPLTVLLGPGPRTLARVSNGAIEVLVAKPDGSPLNRLAEIDPPLGASLTR